MSLVIFSRGADQPDNSFWNHDNFSSSATNQILLTRYNNINFGRGTQKLITIDGSYHKGRIMMARSANNQPYWMLIPSIDWSWGTSSTVNDTSPWAPYISSDNGETWTKCAAPFPIVGAFGSTLHVNHVGCLLNGASRTWLLGAYSKVWTWDAVHSSSGSITRYRIFKSTNDGTSWTEITSSSEYWMLMGSTQNVAYAYQSTGNLQPWSGQVTRDGVTWYATTQTDDDGLPASAISNSTSEIYQVETADDTAGTGQPSNTWGIKQVYYGSSSSFFSYMQRREADHTNHVFYLDQAWEPVNLGNNLWMKVQIPSGATSPNVKFSTDNTSSWQDETTGRFNHIHSGFSHAGYFASNPAGMI